MKERYFDMVELIDMKDDVVKVLFYLNLILLIIGIFVSSKTYFISVIVINIILNGTFIVIGKYGDVFKGRTGLFSNQFGKLGRALDYSHNLGRKNG